MNKQVACPFCERPKVGLNCPEPECKRRLAKQLEEVTPAGGVHGVETHGDRGRRVRSTIREDQGYDLGIRALEDRD